MAVKKLRRTGRAHGRRLRLWLRRAKEGRDQNLGASEPRKSKITGKEEHRGQRAEGIPDPGFWILDSGYWILESGCWMLEKSAEYR